MKEKFNKKTLEDVKFDREAEKKYRQKIRKILSEKISESLDEFGFKKKGHSLWSSKIDDSWHIIYLQRSQFSHEYYIEAGICEEKDIPKGKKPDIIFCKERERIEGIISDIEKERTGKEKNAEELIKKKANDINAALDFEVPGAEEKYPEEYFVPSVDSKEAENKIAKIQKAVSEYVPLWFRKQSRSNSRGPDKKLQ